MQWIATQSVPGRAEKMTASGRSANQPAHPQFLRHSGFVSYHMYHFVLVTKKSRGGGQALVIGKLAVVVI